MAVPNWLKFEELDPETVAVCILCKTEWTERFKESVCGDCGGRLVRLDGSLVEHSMDGNKSPAAVERKNGLFNKPTEDVADGAQRFHQQQTDRMAQRQRFEKTERKESLREIRTERASGPSRSRSIFLLVVLSLLGNVALGALVFQTRSELEKAEQKIESGADASQDAILLVASEVGKVKTQLQRLEQSLYGVAGVPLGTSGVIDDLESCLRYLAGYSYTSLYASGCPTQ